MEINYELELEPYLDQFDRIKRTENKIISCSPFRYEKTPSFAVNLETGVWIDSGAVGTEHYKGNFITLLAFLREETYEDALLYLREIYGKPLKEIDSLQLEVDLSTKEEKPLDPAILDQYNYRHAYLSGRGITEKCQQVFKVGYDRDAKAVSIPHFDMKGNLVNVKFRSVNTKRFKYLPNGLRVKKHIYALDKIYKYGYTEAYVVESEIDALYLWSYGYPAVALSGASLTKRQKELFIISPLNSLIIATDNDRAGHKCAEAIFKELGGVMKLRRLSFPESVNDINEVEKGRLNAVLEKSYAIDIGLVAE